MIEYPPAGVERPGVQSGPARPGKSFVVTWLLALLVGMLGADRFYLGKVGTGLLKLVTCGGAGVWALVDLVLVLTGSQRDKQGRPLAGYPERRTMAWGVTAAFLALGLVVGACGAAVSEGDPPGSAVVDEADDPDEEVAPEGEPEPEPEPVEDEPEPADEPAAEEEPPEAEPAEEDIDAAAWADERFGTFEPVRETGRGDSLVSLPEGATAGLVSASHEGDDGNFALSVLDEVNQPTGDLLVNTIGRYSGTTIYGLHDLGGEGVRIEVMADGPWELVIEPVSAAPALEESGTGDAVFLYEGIAGALHVTHDGDANFTVIEETDEVFAMGLLVNEIGRYEGTVPLSGGPSVISVTADGAWTLQVD